MNKVVILGYVGKEPKEFNNGCSFSVATSERRKDDKDATEWHNIVCFGKTAEIALKYVAKGHQIVLEGKLNTSSYEKDGVKHFQTRIICDRLHLLKNEAKSEKPPEPAKSQPRAPEPEYDQDNIPW